MYEKYAVGGSRRDGGVGVVGGLEMPGFASVCKVLIVVTWIFCGGSCFLVLLEVVNYFIVMDLQENASVLV